MLQLNELVLSAIALSTFALSGCSGGPSNSDIEKAIKANVEQATQQAKNMGGSAVSESMLPKVYGVKNLGCAKEKDATGYICDVEVDASAPFVGRSKQVGKMRFIKGSDGWVISQ